MKKYFCSLAVVFTAIFVLSACNNPTGNIDKDFDGNTSGIINSDENTETDYPPMVMVNGSLYQDTGYVNNAVKCGTPDGKITSFVDHSKLPETNNTSNFGEGYGYQILDGAHISIEINGSWVVFRNLAISSRNIPSCVANFKARVTEASDDRLLVTITSIPDEFKWIFQNNQNKVTKPISLTVENLRFDDGEEVMETKQLIGKTVQVWFDGSVKNNEPEMSYPIELGTIYRITPVKE